MYQHPLQFLSCARIGAYRQWYYYCHHCRWMLSRQGLGDADSPVRSLVFNASWSPFFLGRLSHRPHVGKPSALFPVLQMHPMQRLRCCAVIWPFLQGAARCSISSHHASGTNCEDSCRVSLPVSSLSEKHQRHSVPDNICVQLVATRNIGSRRIHEQKEHLNNTNRPRMDKVKRAVELSTLTLSFPNRLQNIHREAQLIKRRCRECCCSSTRKRSEDRNLSRRARSEEAKR